VSIGPAVGGDGAKRRHHQRFDQPTAWNTDAGVRDEHVPVRVEIGVQAVLVLIPEIVGFFAFPSFLITFGFLKPSRPCPLKVKLHHS
jgi:hypothetical protein